MKKFFTLKFLLLIVLLIGGLKGWGQNYQSFDASTANPFTASTWSASSTTNACVSSGLTNAFITGRIAYFCTPSGTGSGDVSISIGGIIATENYTHSTPSGTLSTGGKVVTIDIANGKVFNLDVAKISTAAGTGLIKTGAGTYQSANPNTFPGGFTLNAGIMIVGSVSAMGGGGSLNINGGTLAANATRTITSKYSGINIGGNFILGTSGNTSNISFTNDNVALGSSIHTIDLAGILTSVYTFGGVISSGTGGGITLGTNSGIGTLVLSGSNTYTGPTTINGGTLSISAINNGGVAGNIGAATNAASNLVLGGGTLLYTGAGETTDRNFTLTNGTTSTISNTNTLTLTGAAVSSTGSLTKTGTGTLVFSGSNQYTGGTTINNGTLQIAASERINDASALSIAGGAGGGTFDLNGSNETVGSLSGAGTITSNAVVSATLIVGGDNSSTSFSGNILIGSGTVSITKQGTGTLALSGNNTYTGTTTINAGTIQSNSASALSATNLVNVNNSGALQISQSQTLANVTLAAGSTLTVDAGKTLTVTGTLTVNTGATVSGTIAYSGAGALVYNGSGSLTAGSEWPTSMVPTSVSINAGATIVLAAMRTTTTTLTIDGTLDAATYSITGGGTANINGTLITQNPNGLIAGGATFIGATLALGASSTIVYNANGDQAVQGAAQNLLYYNMIFSGSGTKTLSSTPYNNSGTIPNPSGTITVSGSATFNAQNWTFGGSGTNLTMTGTSTYKTAGTTAKPDATGTYTLGLGTTIEFTNIAGTEETIRTAPNYANIVVSGSNVADHSDFFPALSIKIQSGGSFTVTNTGIFKVHNINGFSGAANTSIASTNSPTINLQSGSTIQYNRGDVTAQQITNSISYQNLIIDGAMGNKNAPSGTLTIQGNFIKSNSSTFSHNSGTILFDGGATAQSYTSNSEVLFNNVTNKNLNTVTGLSINSDMAIAGQLTLNASSIFNLASGRNVTLKSSATSTANVAAIPASASIMYGTGASFTVERYIQAVRAWRFLAVPLNSSKTIHENWQENQAAGSPTPVGFGTQLSTDDVLATGFDFVTTAPGTGPGLKTYDALTNEYVGVSSTLAPFDPSLGGYMTFIRGDRTITGFSTTSTATTLRIKGALFTGDNSPATILMNQTTPVNNPFASRIDLNQIDPSHNFTFYIWDPTLGGTTYGVGAIRTISWDPTASAYTIAPTGGYTGSPGFIESGQAFFARGFSDGNLIMKESVKSAGSALVSAPVSAAQQAPQLQTNLYAIEGGNAVLKDGIVSSFDDAYSNSIDGADAVKFANFNENLAIIREDKLLEIERRHSIVQNDTIFLNLSGLRLDHYRFEIVATGLNTNGLTGFVEDNYLHTKTVLNLTGSTFIDFSIDAEEGSSASNRFRIVMNAPEAGPLPVTVTNVKAYVQNANIAVEWKVVNETGIQQYEIEKSIDGIHFQKSGSVAAKNLSANNYQWLDDHAVVGYNYYRIRIVNADGKINYTNVVKVFIDKIKSAITIYPNPIQNGIINLQLVNQPAGEYHLRLLNKLGQNILSKQINHAGGSSVEQIKSPGSLAHGIYQLEVIRPGGGVKRLDIIY